MHDYRSSDRFLASPSTTRQVPVVVPALAYAKGAASEATTKAVIVSGVVTKQLRETAMLRFLVVLLVMLGTAYAADLKATLPASGMPQEVIKCTTLSALDKTAVERSGCCSHHGGVCGCSGGRQQCCDGALSPSCTCHHEDNEKLTN